MQSFAIKVSTNHEGLNKQLVKYTSFINNFFRETSTSNIYVERVIDGFILFFESWAHFSRSFQPYAQKYHEVAKRGKKNNELIGGLGLQEESFPKGGLELRISPTAGPKKIMTTIIQKFYNNLAVNVLVSNKNGDVRVLFEEGAQFKYYIDLFMAVMDDKYNRS